VLTCRLRCGADGGCLSRAEDVNRVIDTALDAFGRVDVLCNNAGIPDGFHMADDLDESLWDRVIDINLKAAYLAARRVLPSMLERNHGVIINMASIAAVRGAVAAWPTPSLSMDLLV
jgi:3-oxoacyl-[acyl-carrier protein] reductase